jgi:gliding motility-associated-like protein
LKFLTILFLICFGWNVSSAQSSSIRDYHLWVSENTYLPYWLGNVLSENDFNVVGQPTLSFDNGKPFLGNAQFFLVDLQSIDKIKNSDSLVPIQLRFSCWFQRNDTTFDLIGFYDSALVDEGLSYLNFNFGYNFGYEFDTLKKFPSGYYRHTVTKTVNGLRCTEKNVLLLKKPTKINEDKSNEYRSSLGSVQRISDFSYLFVSNNRTPLNSGIELYKVENGLIYLVDSLKLNAPNMFFKEPILIPMELRKYKTFPISDIIFNFNKTKMYFTVGIEMFIDTLNLSRSFIEYRGLFSVDINPTTFRISSAPKELWYFQTTPNYQNLLDRKFLNQSITGLALSSNDSFLYFNIRTNSRDSIDGAEKLFNKSDLCYSNILNTTFALNLIRESTPNRYFQLNPFGKIVTRLNNEGILLPNSNHPNGTQTEIIKLPDNHIITLRPFIYDYIRLKDTIEYDCEAHVTIKNRSDLSLGMNSFTWYFKKEDGSMDTLTGFEPQITYSKNGDYPFKCYGYSPTGNGGNGYGEYYIDTLHVRIPPKPIARFRALDTVVCAYQPVGFHNTSSASSVHPTKEQKWVYTFGDGSTRTLTEWKDSVQHTYNQPGVYTVSLFYSNGYCDSTLVLNQHVRVVDAPAPGFAIAETQGCAPFDIHITDTITVNTVKKEYSFDNGLTWKEVPVNQPDIDHSYTESGVYWVTQRLHGYTGCITQVDSIQVFVSKGFTASDTSHIFVATWQDVLPKQENWVSIQWDCLDETAHSYELKRNNQTMATFTECNGIGSFEDMEANANPNLRYRIVAADSCGRSTQVGSIGQPIFLQGAIKGQNEWAVIEFSPYADIQHQSGEFAYDIQTFSEGNWKTIHQPNAAGLFEDKPLISNDVNALEKCYRIVGQNQVQISISNVLCLPYLPSVILPSAFSPNGDALNEIYRPLTLGIVSYQMEIYNRWGQLIYSGDESQIGWDGNNAPQGVYVVKIQGIDNQNYFHSYVGSVTLVR